MPPALWSLTSNQAHDSSLLRPADGAGLLLYTGRIAPGLLYHPCHLHCSQEEDPALPPEMHLVCCREDSHPAALPKLPFALSWWEAVRVLVDRQWKLTVRDGSLVRGRIIQVSPPPPLHLLLAALSLQARAPLRSPPYLWLWE